uniref:histidine--tRNA ligase n=1 Tax=Rhodogorgon sp. TaxID=2485824 RepID=A0A3G3MHT0_9FLOR|nr:histidine tRNA synthetase [Rhodogorgon sp.]
MQPIRGTKDILPDEIELWQNIYFKVLRIFTQLNYDEIRTPIIELKELFTRSIGNETDIVNKEMYSFIDQSERNITLRPEGTASIARAFISNKLYHNNSINRLWYLGPMFRYERPQSGRQRQFHQLGVECLGSASPMADTEVIKIANQILSELGCTQYTIEINSIGNPEERALYINDFLKYMDKYEKDLDADSKKRLHINPLRIMDSKNIKTQTILKYAPCINQYLDYESQQHFELICEYLNVLEIPHKINHKLVRGLDYYNQTAFEITTKELGSQNTICGGGRYDTLIKQLGGPHTPAVGWAMGIERLLLVLTKNQINQKNTHKATFYIATKGVKAQKKAWSLTKLLEQNGIKYRLDFSQNSFQKQLKKANQFKALGCLIIGDDEIENETITIKWLETKYQETVKYNNIVDYLYKSLDETLE